MRFKSTFYYFPSVTCGSPANVPLSSSTNNGVNVGDTVTYTCDTGYAISGQMSNTSMATCGANGVWTIIPTCLGECMSLGNVIKNGSLTNTLLNQLYGGFYICILVWLFLKIIERESWHGNLNLAFISPCKCHTQLLVVCL